MKKCDEQVYIALKEYIEENGYPPTIRELCNLTGKNSTSTIVSRLASLENSGKIDIRRNNNGKMMCRTISIIEN